MSTAGAFVPLIHEQLAELKKISSSMWHRQLRECIAKTEEYMQQLNTTKDRIDFDKALEPFFRSIASNKKSDMKLFQPLVLDCFYKLFSQSSREFYPDRDITQKIINIIIKADSFPSDEVNLKCCNVCIACLRSACGIYYCHGTFLSQMFKLLFRIYNNSENTNTFNSIETAIRETLLALFDSYLSSPEIPNGKTVSELAASVINGLIENSQAIFEYLGPVLSDGDYSVTIRDVDVYVVLALLSSIIESNELELRTVHLAARLLVQALKVESSFYSTNAFRSLLQSKIHVCVLALTLDPRKKLAKVTADLIILLWQRFAPIYLESLNEVFLKGLATALGSPDPQTVSKTLTLYSELVKQPRLFVSAFINYDCDDTGHFPNVFAKTVAQLVKISYPDSEQTPVQKQAIELLVSLINYLWRYFNDFQASEEQVQETAESFIKAKKAKNFLEAGIALFKKSAKKGLAFFIQHKFVEDTPASIAQFLFDNPSLDPAGVGEVLGSSGERNINILKAYVALFDFKGHSFENAFRTFLSSFQIPGEAQMIDRVMEQFGQKYYNDNPTLFSSANTVYVLSYSTLMLHTDAHHPNVKSRMTLEQFLANNRGIDDGKDLPREFLEDLYNGIRSKKIFCSTGTSLPSSSLLTREQRADLFKAQAAEALTQARSRSEIRHDERCFHKANSPLLVQPMFEAIWGGVLASLTMTFEQATDPKMYKLCLRGMADCVHIASHCFIAEPLQTLVDSFAKFTALKFKKLDEIKQKNIDCCNTLMRIALSDGNFLKEAWPIVVDQMSELDKIRLSKALPFKYDVDLSEDLINKSGALDRESILDFVAAMCKKSKEELAEGRQFMLQRLGLIAYFNVSREHFIWTQIWALIGEHLGEVGAKSGVVVSNVAVDILRQTAEKYLKVPELSDMHFQEDFMKPFADIFEGTSDTTVKEYTLFCVKGLMQKFFDNLKSGWNVILKILLVASAFPETENLGFDITQSVFKQLDKIPSQYLNLITLTRTYVSAAQSLEIRTKAMDDFTLVSEKTQLTEVNVWASIFESLAGVSLSTEPTIRKKAHEIMLAIFDRAVSENISLSVTSEVLASRIPTFMAGFDATDKVFYQQAAEFIGNFFTSLVTKHYEASFSNFFESLLNILSVAIHSVNDHLSETGISQLREFVKTVQPQLDDEKKSLVLKALKDSANRVCSLSLNNGKLFVAALVQFCELFQSIEFIELLEIVDSACERQDESDEKRVMLWPVVRSSLLTALLIKKEETKEKITQCVFRTLELYHTLEFAHKKLPASPVWSAEVVVTLELLNGMSDDFFAACFEKAAPMIVEIVTAQSLAVRKHVSAALKRKLL